MRGSLIKLMSNKCYFKRVLWQLAAAMMLDTHLTFILIALYLTFDQCFQ